MKTALITLFALISITLFSFLFQSVANPGKAIAQSNLIKENLSNPTTETSVKAQGELQVMSVTDEPVSPIGFLAGNWGKLLLAISALYDILARMIPTIQNNTILNFITQIINGIVPNKRKGGGVF